MHDPIKVLDHGYVRFVEAWGHGDAGKGEPEYDGAGGKADDFECGLVEAARQSTQGSFRHWEDVLCCGCVPGGIAFDGRRVRGEPGAFYVCTECDGTGTQRGDQRLLRYLHNNDPQHATPFEFGGMIVEVEAPTCVVWEWVRHRTHSLTDDAFSGDVGFNIMSSRYGEIPYKDFHPDTDRCMSVSKSNKQAGAIDGAKEVTPASAAEWLGELNALYDHSQRVYTNGLSAGVPKEVARLALTFGRYWRFRVTAYLRNWLAFVCLRSHPKAQEEIRLYSQAVEQLLAKTFPRTYDLFLKRRERG